MQWLLLYLCYKTIELYFILLLSKIFLLHYVIKAMYMKSHSVSHCYLLGNKKKIIWHNKNFFALSHSFFQKSAWETENQFFMALWYNFKPLSLLTNTTTWRPWWKWRKTAAVMMLKLSNGLMFFFHFI